MAHLARSLCPSLRSVLSIAPISRAGPSRLAHTNAVRPKRTSWLSVGLAGVGAVSLLGYCASREAVHLEAPPQSALKSPIVPATGGKSIYIEPTTSLELPTTLPPTASLLPQGSGPLVLVGAGVRTVSFLSIRVYVAALYVDAKALKEGGALRNLPDWKSYGKNRLLEGPKGEESAVSGEQLVKQLVDSGVPMVIRIVPVRSTDFAHLRDGFTRAVQGRAKSARKSGALSGPADESLSSSLQSLKELFPRGSVPKGSPMDLVIAPLPGVSPRGVPSALTPKGSRQAVEKSWTTGTPPSGAHVVSPSPEEMKSTPMVLSVEYDGKVLGRVDPPKDEAGGFSVARELCLAYFADKDEISKPLKRAVAEGFEDLLKGRQ